MTAKKVLLLVAAGTLLSIATRADARPKFIQPLEQFNAEQCCENEIEQVRTAASIPIEEKYVIRVFIDASLENKNKKDAAALPCSKKRGEAHYNCDISVTEKLKLSFSHDEFMRCLPTKSGTLLAEGAINREVRSPSIMRINFHSIPSKI